MKKWKWRKTRIYLPRLNVESMRGGGCIGGNGIRSHVRESYIANLLLCQQDTGEPETRNWSTILSHGLLENLCLVKLQYTIFDSQVSATGYNTPLKACQLIAGLTSTCPQSEINDRPATFLVTCGHNVESTVVGCI